MKNINKNDFFAIILSLFLSIFSSSVLAQEVSAHLDTDGDGIANNSDPFPNDASNAKNEKWVYCADDWRTCRPPIATQVRYGVEGRYFFEKAEGSILCRSETFGDPAPYFIKTCDYLLSASNDADADGVVDSLDVYPADPSESADSDGDGLGDNGDPFPNDASNAKNEKWVYCADDWRTCRPPIATLVRYGVEGRYFFEKAEGSILCRSETFGDPAPYITKTCDYLLSASNDADADGVVDSLDVYPADPSESADTDGDGLGDNSDPFPNDASNAKNAKWVHCANDWRTCHVPIATLVRYGVEGRYFFEKAEGSILCRSATFGDPAPYVTKTCDYLVGKEAGRLFISDIYFEDEAFSSCVIDTALENGWQYANEMTYLYCDNPKIESASGIELLTALTQLDLNLTQLKTLDLLNNTALTAVSLEDNPSLSTIKLPNSTSLEELYLYENALTNIDVSNNPALTDLNISSSFAYQLPSIDLSANSALTKLTLRFTRTTHLDLSNNTNLSILDLDLTDLTSLDLSNNTALTQVRIENSLYLSTIDLPTSSELAVLNLYSNSLTSLDVSKNPALTELDLSNNLVSAIDLSANTILTKLNAGGNQLTSIDLSTNTALTSLILVDNQISSIDLSANTALAELSLGGKLLSSVDLSANSALTELALFRSSLSNIDLTSNGALTHLDLSYNPLLRTIDLSANTALSHLGLKDNFRLGSIDLSSNIALTNLAIFNSSLLKTIDLSANTALTGLHLIGSPLTSIDLSSNTALTKLNLSNNNLTSLDLSANTALIEIHVSDNLLKAIDLSFSPHLEYVKLAKNQLTAVDGIIGNDDFFNYIKEFITLDLAGNNKLPCAHLEALAAVKSSAGYFKVIRPTSCMK